MKELLSYHCRFIKSNKLNETAESPSLRKVLVVLEEIFAPLTVLGVCKFTSRIKQHRLIRPQWWNQSTATSTSVRPENRYCVSRL